MREVTSDHADQKVEQLERGSLRDLHNLCKLMSLWLTTLPTCGCKIAQENDKASNVVVHRPLGTSRSTMSISNRVRR